MGEARKRIQQINSSAVHNRRSIITEAQVMSSDSKKNTCEIEYLDKDGYLSKQDKVTVATNNPSFQSWFPDEKDFVMITITENIITINGPLIQDYHDDINSKYKTKFDQLTNNFEGDLCGTIF